MRILSATAKNPSDGSIFTKVLWVLIIGYFTYHLVQGERGILAMWRLQSQLTHANDQLTELRQTRTNMEKHVQLLHPNHVDSDMLDEQARVSLGYAGSNEVMILLPKGSDAAVVVMPHSKN